MRRFSLVALMVGLCMFLFVSPALVQKKPIKPALVQKKPIKGKKDFGTPAGACEDQCRKALAHARSRCMPKSGHSRRACLLQALARYEVCIGRCKK